MWQDILFDFVSESFVQPEAYFDTDGSPSPFNKPGWRGNCTTSVDSLISNGSDDVLPPILGTEDSGVENSFESGSSRKRLRKAGSVSPSSGGRAHSAAPQTPTPPASAPGLAMMATQIVKHSGTVTDGPPSSHGRPASPAPEFGLAGLSSSMVAASSSKDGSSSSSSSSSSTAHPKKLGGFSRIFGISKKRTKSGASSAKSPKQKTSVSSSTTTATSASIGGVSQGGSTPVSAAASLSTNDTSMGTPIPMAAPSSRGDGLSFPSTGGGRTSRSGTMSLDDYEVSADASRDRAQPSSVVAYKTSSHGSSSTTGVVSTPTIPESSTTDAAGESTVMMGGSSATATATVGSAAASSSSSSTMKRSGSIGSSGNSNNANKRGRKKHKHGSGSFIESTPLMLGGTQEKISSSLSSSSGLGWDELSGGGRGSFSEDFELRHRHESTANCGERVCFGDLVFILWQGSGYLAVVKFIGKLDLDSHRPCKERRSCALTAPLSSSSSAAKSASASSYPSPASSNNTKKSGSGGGSFTVHLTQPRPCMLCMTQNKPSLAETKFVNTVSGVVHHYDSPTSGASSGLRSAPGSTMMTLDPGAETDPGFSDTEFMSDDTETVTTAAMMTKQSTVLSEGGGFSGGHSTSDVPSAFVSRSARSSPLRAAVSAPSSSARSRRFPSEWGFAAVSSALVDSRGSDGRMDYTAAMERWTPMKLGKHRLRQESLMEFSMTRSMAEPSLLYSMSRRASQQRVVGAAGRVMNSPMMQPAAYTSAPPLLLGSSRSISTNVLHPTEETEITYREKEYYYGLECLLKLDYIQPVSPGATASSDHGSGATAVRTGGSSGMSDPTSSSSAMSSESSRISEPTPTSIASAMAAAGSSASSAVGGTSGVKRQSGGLGRKPKNVSFIFDVPFGTNGYLMQSMEHKKVHQNADCKAVRNGDFLRRQGESGHKEITPEMCPKKYTRKAKLKRALKKRSKTGPTPRSKFPGTITDEGSLAYQSGRMHSESTASKKGNGVSTKKKKKKRGIKGFLKRSKKKRRSPSSTMSKMSGSSRTGVSGAAAAAAIESSAADGSVKKSTPLVNAFRSTIVGGARSADEEKGESSSPELIKLPMSVSADESTIAGFEFAKAGPSKSGISGDTETETEIDDTDDEYDSDFKPPTSSGMRPSQLQRYKTRKAVQFHSQTATSNGKKTLPRARAKGVTARTTAAASSSSASVATATARRGRPKAGRLLQMDQESITIGDEAVYESGRIRSDDEFYRSRSVISPSSRSRQDSKPLRSPLEGTGHVSLDRMGEEISHEDTPPPGRLSLQKLDSRGSSAAGISPMDDGGGQSDIPSLPRTVSSPHGSRERQRVMEVDKRRKQKRKQHWQNTKFEAEKNKAHVCKMENHRGRRYFECADKRGLILPREHILQKIDVWGIQTTPSVSRGSPASHHSFMSSQISSEDLIPRCNCRQVHALFDLAQLCGRMLKEMDMISMPKSRKRGRSLKKLKKQRSRKFSKKGAGPSSATGTTTTSVVGGTGSGSTRKMGSSSGIHANEPEIQGKQMKRIVRFGKDYDLRVKKEQYGKLLSFSQIAFDAIQHVIRNYDSPQRLTIGDYVTAKWKGDGCVKFIGLLKGLSDPWVGLELRLPNGKHDGRGLDGTRYFYCTHDSKKALTAKEEELLKKKQKQQQPMGSSSVAAASAVTFVELSRVSSAEDAELKELGTSVTPRSRGSTLIGGPVKTDVGIFCRLSDITKIVEPSVMGAISDIPSCTPHPKGPPKAGSSLDHFRSGSITSALSPRLDPTAAAAASSSSSSSISPSTSAAPKSPHFNRLSPKPKRKGSTAAMCIALKCKHSPQHGHFTLRKRESTHRLLSLNNGSSSSSSSGSSSGSGSGYHSRHGSMAGHSTPRGLTRPATPHSSAVGSRTARGGSISSSVSRSRPGHSSSRSVNGIDGSPQTPLTPPSIKESLKQSKRYYIRLSKQMRDSLLKFDIGGMAFKLLVAKLMIGCITMNEMNDIRNTFHTLLFLKRFKTPDQRKLRMQAALQFQKLKNRRKERTRLLSSSMTTEKKGKSRMGDHDSSSALEKSGDGSGKTSTLSAVTPAAAAKRGAGGTGKKLSDINEEAALSIASIAADLASMTKMESVSAPVSDNEDDKDERAALMAKLEEGDEFEFDQWYVPMSVDTDTVDFEAFMEGMERFGFGRYFDKQFVKQSIISPARKARSSVNLLPKDASKLTKKKRSKKSSISPSTKRGKHSRSRTSKINGATLKRGRSRSSIMFDGARKAKAKAYREIFDRLDYTHCGELRLQNFIYAFSLYKCLTNLETIFRVFLLYRTEYSPSGALSSVGMASVGSQSSPTAVTTPGSVSGTRPSSTHSDLSYRVFFRSGVEPLMRSVSDKMSHPGTLTRSTSNASGTSGYDTDSESDDEEMPFTEFETVTEGALMRFTQQIKDEYFTDGESDDELAMMDPSLYGTELMPTSPEQLAVLTDGSLFTQVSRLRDFYDRRFVEWHRFLKNRKFESLATMRSMNTISDHRESSVSISVTGADDSTTKPFKRGHSMSDTPESVSHDRLSQSSTMPSSRTSDSKFFSPPPGFRTASSSRSTLTSSTSPGTTGTRVTFDMPDSVKRDSDISLSTGVLYSRPMTLKQTSTVAEHWFNSRNDEELIHACMKEADIHDGQLTFKKFVNCMYDISRRKNQYLSGASMMAATVSSSGTLSGGSSAMTMTSSLSGGTVSSSGVSGLRSTTIGLLGTVSVDSTLAISTPLSEGMSTKPKLSQRVQKSLETYDMDFGSEVVMHDHMLDLVAPPIHKLVRKAVYRPPTFIFNQCYEFVRYMKFIEDRFLQQLLFEKQQFGLSDDGERWPSRLKRVFSENGMNQKFTNEDILNSFAMLQSQIHRSGKGGGSSSSSSSSSSGSASPAPSSLVGGLSSKSVSQSPPPSTSEVSSGAGTVIIAQDSQELTEDEAEFSEDLDDEDEEDDEDEDEEYDSAVVGTLDNYELDYSSGSDSSSDSLELDSDTLQFSEDDMLDEDYSDYDSEDTDGDESNQNTETNL